MKIGVNDLLDLEHTISKDLFSNVRYPYEVINNIGDYIRALGGKLDKNKYKELGEDIWISNTASISNMATIIGPCIIDDDVEVRPGAYIRGKVIIGKNSVVGNSCEIKNSIIFDNSQIPHFNYIGDSILGYHSHLGAGVIISNLKSDKSNVVIKGEYNIETNMRKMGAIIGDNVEVGCNSVIVPGSIIGRNTSIYPLTMVRGVIPENSIIKDKNTVVEKETKNG